MVVGVPSILQRRVFRPRTSRVLLDAIARVVEPIRISYLWRPVLSDPGDDLVLETAVNGRAEVVVTFNRRHFWPAAAPFGLRLVWNLTIGYAVVDDVG